MFDLGVDVEGVGDCYEFFWIGVEFGVDFGCIFEFG